MIKSSGSRRGWRGGRRIVLVVGLSVVGRRSRDLRLGGDGIGEPRQMQGQHRAPQQAEPRPRRGFQVPVQRGAARLRTGHEQDIRLLRHRGRGHGPERDAGADERDAPVHGQRAWTRVRLWDAEPRCLNRLHRSARIHVDRAAKRSAARHRGPRHIRADSATTGSIRFDTVDVQVGFPQNPCKPTGPVRAGQGQAANLDDGFDRAGGWLLQRRLDQLRSNTSIRSRARFLSEPFKVNVKPYAKCPGGGGGESKGKKTAASADVSGGLPRIW